VPSPTAKFSGNTTNRIMRYEHLIEINDPLSAANDPLSREDLWQGLMLRAYSPQKFALGMEGAIVAELSRDAATTVLARTLDYGVFKVNDTVTLRSGAAMITDVAASDGVAKGRLTITIEEPAASRLYLRFLYELDEADATSGWDATTAALREQAYFASDMDTVAQIRELAKNRRMR
jgi:hypothetical protein